MASFVQIQECIQPKLRHLVAGNNLELDPREAKKGFKTFTRRNSALWAASINKITQISSTYQND